MKSASLIARETDSLPGTILIGGTEYRYRLVRTLAFRVVRLYKGDGFEGETYEVRATKADGRVVCDCADFFYRQRKMGGVCKHGAAMAVLAGE